MRTPLVALGLRPRRARGFTLIELLVVVAIIGILAAVAIPSFVKYIRRSKTTEATMNLRKLFDASVAYFASDFGASGGGALAHQFPGNLATLTPLGTCCLLNPGAKCAPQSSLWTSPTWRALAFSVDEPFYFQYGYRSSGTDKTAQFTAGAYGDLNCDGTLSTYERAGSVDAKLGVTGASGLYVVRDID